MSAAAVTPLPAVGASCPVSSTARPTPAGGRSTSRVSRRPTPTATASRTSGRRPTASIPPTRPTGPPTARTGTRTWNTTSTSWPPGGSDEMRKYVLAGACVGVGLLIGAASGQYPKVPKAVQAAENARQAAYEKPEDEAWAKAQPELAEWAKKGKPYL